MTKLKEYHCDHCGATLPIFDYLCEGEKTKRRQSKSRVRCQACGEFSDRVILFGGEVMDDK
jgi:DNA-directed RNA polymerase subunit RPC12/RpoP